jgi:hypothetical protein
VELRLLTPVRRLVHDLNNVLFVLYGRCDSMREQLPEDHPVHDDIDAITMAAERLQSLVADIKAAEPAPPEQDCTDSSASAS